MIPQITEVFIVHSMSINNSSQRLRKKKKAYHELEYICANFRSLAIKYSESIKEYFQQELVN